MKTLKITDNSARKKADFSGIPALTEAVKDKTLAELEALGVFVLPDAVRTSDDITAEQMILKSDGADLRTGNIMGFIGMGDERLTIGSRFDGENGFFFRYLIERASGMPNLLNLETSSETDKNILAVLMFLFPSYLKAALRKGVFKSYIRINHNDSSPKGKIETARHIAENTPFIGKIAYSERLFSFDNCVTQLIRHTIEYIKRMPCGRAILAKAADEVKLITSVTQSFEQKNLQKVIAENQTKSPKSAYYNEYRSLQKLCILILQNEKRLPGGGQRDIHGILFDGAWLWEEYLATVTGDGFYHPQNKAKSGGQWLFAENNGRIFPDFLGKNPQNRIIADAKYKPADNIGNRDFLQILAYMFRFEAKTGYFLYPSDTAVEDTVYHLAGGSSFEHNFRKNENITVIKHGLKIPKNASDYDEFSALMREAEAGFKLCLLPQ